MSLDLNRPILLIDDDSFMLNVMAASLKAVGFRQIETRGSGAAALEALDRPQPPMILLCDLQMPEMDGPELLRRLADRGYPGGVILISGEDRRILRLSERLGRAHGLEILGALEKPVDGAQVLALIRAFKPAQPKRSAPQAPEITDIELRVALREGQILPFYQPKIEAQTGALVGVEALARWRHPSRGVLSPFFFLPMVESLGLMGALVERMLNASLAQLRGWREAGLDLKLAVNVDADTLGRLDLPRRIEGLLRAHGVEGRALTLEITESGAIQDIKATLETLTRLSLKGITLSIDDFGTGYASLEQLSRLPFSELKIDRMFVHDVAANESARAILETSLELAQRLGMTTVAEGAENLTDWRLVQSLGCHQIQGFFAAQPMEGAALSPWASVWAQRVRAEGLSQA
ncbi:EAL domain-containing response regulator [Myxococcota bacterium]|nr:EAL domain-containing response regulator [Myxococcota bacterium]MBU1428944.1 EAL domain-containing response regulator [Myxococcota bacterium]MBU1898238.1 EAL domain-containing response regulator [Myxococcota bacterium]